MTSNLGKPMVGAFPIIPEKAVSVSLQIFESLWRSRDLQMFVLADLLLGAYVSNFNLRFAEALGLAWLVIEKLLNERWLKYIQQNRVRNGKSFINNDRLERLKGIDYSASIRSEILSLLNEFSQEEYVRLNQIRGTRNKWFHGLNSVTLEESHAALVLAENMFREKYDFVATIVPYAGGSFIGGGDYLVRDPDSIDNRSLREISIPKATIHHSSLDAELRSALKNRTSGSSYNGKIFRVHLFEDATIEDEKLATEIVQAHSPAFLTLDEPHKFLPGEYKFDGQRLQNHIIGDGVDIATVNINVPYGNKTEVTILVDSEQRIVELKNGAGKCEITSILLPGSIITVSVERHPSDPLTIEVMASN
jgi:hypothetical protein